MGRTDLLNMVGKNSKYANYMTYKKNLDNRLWNYITEMPPFEEPVRAQWLSPATMGPGVRKEHPGQRALAPR